MCIIYIFIYNICIDCFYKYKYIHIYIYTVSYPLTISPASIVIKSYSKWLALHILSTHNSRCNNRV